METRAAEKERNNEQGGGWESQELTAPQKPQWTLFQRKAIEKAAGKRRGRASGLGRTPPDGGEDMGVAWEIGGAECCLGTTHGERLAGWKGAATGKGGHGDAGRAKCEGWGIVGDLSAGWPSMGGEREMECGGRCARGIWMSTGAAPRTDG